MRVLHVDTGREWRGGQVQLRALVDGAPGEHHVAAPPEAPLVEVLRRAGHAVHPTRFRGRWVGSGSLRALVRDLAPDVVAVHTGHAHVHATAVDAPVVLHRRLDFWPSPAGRRRARRARGVVAVSEGVAAVLRACGVPETRVAVVPDGVDPAPPSPALDLPRALDLPTGTPVVVAVGALVPHKGHRVLVDALPHLPGVHAAVLGEGPLRRALLRRARRRGVAHRLHLVGHRDDGRAWMAGAAVVCHPSLEEGLGQAVIEAALEGAAIVASRTGGLPEVVAGLGLLVPPGEPVALADALRRALDTAPDLRATARARAPHLTARHSVQAMVVGTMSAYVRFVG